MWLNRQQHISNWHTHKHVHTSVCNDKVNCWWSVYYVGLFVSISAVFIRVFLVCGFVLSVFLVLSVQCLEFWFVCWCCQCTLFFLLVLSVQCLVCWFGCGCCRCAYCLLSVFVGAVFCISLIALFSIFACQCYSLVIGGVCMSVCCWCCICRF